MNTAFEKLTTDFSFNEYQQRQLLSVSPLNIDQQSDLIRCSDNYIFHENNWNISEYKGYVVLSMVEQNTENDRLFIFLKHLKNLLDEKINTTPSWYLLPENSYHQTIANLLSDVRFKENVVNKGLESNFPQLVKEAFASINIEKQHKAIQMEMLGLTVFGSCIALLGRFNNPADYNSIIEFRRQLYSSNLKELNIKWTRPFVGHVTLAYLGRNYNLSDKIILSQTIKEINQSLPPNLKFNITMSELRSYQTLSQFDCKPEYPRFSFIR